MKLHDIMKACHLSFTLVGVFSFFINVLMLTVPIYMLQLFDRVIASQSYETLFYLTFIAIVAILAMALLDLARSQVMIRVGKWLDNRLSPLALSRSMDDMLSGDGYAPQSLSDINTVRQFISSSGMYAFFDAPWVIIYLIVIYLLSISLGVIATIGAIILFFLAILNETASRKLITNANLHYNENQKQIDTSLHNAESIQAMGMLDRIINHWYVRNEAVLKHQSKASERSSAVLSTSKFIRLTLQILILGVGAYLVIEGELTAGAMIAASIIMGRGVAPIEQAIGAWKQFVSSKQAYNRLKNYINAPVARESNIELSKPTGVLQVEHATFVPKGHEHPILFNIQFNLAAGESLAIIGPSGAGKSTLARLLVGLWPTTEGHIRIDDQDIYQWNPQNIGQFLGYLPQKVALFHDTIKTNIARMDPTPKDDDVIAAADYVGAHHMILKLAQNYATPATGYQLSGGQIQRIALARAFYGQPCFVVLDEPESNLDQDGLLALQHAIEKAKQQKTTLIAVTQNLQLAQRFSKCLVLNGGRLQAFGNSQDILSTYLGPQHGKP